MPDWLQQILKMLPQANSALGQAGQAAGNVNQIMNLLRPQQGGMQVPPAAQKGQPSPFQSSQPVQAPGPNAGGGSIMDLIRMLMQGAH